MSDAPQRDRAGETRGPATDDDKADLKSCLLRGLVTTRLNTLSPGEGGQKKEIQTG
jgi:hypothetical protein